MWAIIPGSLREGEHGGDEVDAVKLGCTHGGRRNAACEKPLHLPGPR